VVMAHNPPIRTRHRPQLKAQFHDVRNDSENNPECVDGCQDRIPVCLDRSVQNGHCYTFVCDETAVESVWRDSIGCNNNFAESNPCTDMFLMQNHITYTIRLAEVLQGESSQTSMFVDCPDIASANRFVTNLYECKYHPNGYSIQ
jgi:hypothetical protein